MKITPNYKALLVGVSLLSLCSQANAGGFEVRETVSPQLMGVAQAGIAASNDLSGTYVNPAVMGLVGESQVKVINHMLFARSEFKGESTVNNRLINPTGVRFVSGNNGGNAQGPVLIPALYGMCKVHESGDSKLFLGLSVTAPWGQKTEYPLNWKGRHLATKTEMVTINIAPMMAYQVNKRFSAGFGLQLQTMNVELARVGFLPFFHPLIPAGDPSETPIRLKASQGLAMGWLAGIVLCPTDSTRIGFGYRSQISHRLTGKFEKDNAFLDATGRVPINNSNFYAHLKTPDSITMSIVQKCSDWFTVMGGATYTHWSVFKELRAVYPDAPTVADTIEPQDWRNTWFLKLGCEVKPSQDVTLRAGYAYDQTPTKIEHRSPRLPDANRFWLTCGVDWQINKDWNVALSYVHVVVHTPRVDLPISATRVAGLTGKFDASVKILTASVTWKFNPPQFT